jgi:Protein of unknown function (DUF3263)
MWTLASAWTSGLMGTLVDMARVARSEVATDTDVAPDMTVASDIRDESSPPVALVAPAVSSAAVSAGRRLRPPRPRDGEVDDNSDDGQAESVHDQLVEAAHESSALEASVLEASGLEAAALEAAALEAAALEASGLEASALDAAALEASGLEASALEAADASSDVASESAGSPRARVRTERTPLTDRERAMLEFERFWWRHAGSKEQAIRETFDLSATHYYRLLNALLDQPAAVEFDALVVGRLRRLRASRARRRAGR